MGSEVRHVSRREAGRPLGAGEFLVMRKGRSPQMRRTAKSAICRARAEILENAASRIEPSERESR
jgi:hypothetical protein